MASSESIEDVGMNSHYFEDTDSEGFAEAVEAFEEEIEEEAEEEAEAEVDEVDDPVPESFFTSEPSDPNLDFENLQRDCSDFPAYYDYIYDRPDTREEPTVHPDVAKPRGRLPPESCQKLWEAPETQAFRFLNHRAAAMTQLHNQRMAAITAANQHSNGFPQLRGLSQPIPKAPAQGPDMSPAQGPYMAPAGTQILRGGLPPSNNQAPGPVPAQQTQHGLIQPHEIARYLGFSDLEKQQINNEVVQAWHAVRNMRSPQPAQRYALAFLQAMTKNARDRHCDWMMRDSIRKLFEAIKVRQLGDPKHPEFENARRWMLNFESKLDPRMKGQIKRTIQQMLQAEYEGRNPMDEVHWGLVQPPPAPAPAPLPPTSRQPTFQQMHLTEREGHNSTDAVHWGSRQISPASAPLSSKLDSQIQAMAPPTFQQMYRAERERHGPMNHMHRSSLQPSPTPAPLPMNSSLASSTSKSSRSPSTSFHSASAPTWY